MHRQHFVVSILCASAFGGAALAQAPAKIDFRRDVQPLLKAHCIGCHGPTQQMSNFRLDRRRDAIRGGTISVIVPNLIFEELEIQKIRDVAQKPPIVPSPLK